MGAQQFWVTEEGRTANDAFRSAVDHARWEYGNGGYTGTIAEKGEFVLITPPTGIDPRTYADLLNEYEPNPEKLAGFQAKFKRDLAAIDDKWGPAGCVALGNNKYLFFGSASS